MSTVSLRLLGALVALVLVAACSAKSAPPSASPADAAAEPAGDGDAMEMKSPAAAPAGVSSGRDEPDEDFDRAEAELTQLFSEKEGAEELSQGDRCANACRALGTMTRAAERVCQLEPDGDRCESVRERTERARERVRSACPSCG